MVKVLRKRLTEPHVLIVICAGVRFISLSQYHKVKNIEKRSDVSMGSYSKHYLGGKCSRLESYLGDCKPPTIKRLRHPPK